MSLDQWTEVDQYFSSFLLPADPILEAALASSSAAGLPAIAVSPSQGKLLQILAQMIQARSILEIGTLGGYSTIWLARGLVPGGRIVTLEVDPKHAEVARANFERGGLKDIVEVRVDSASSSLPQLVREKAGPFDLIFIDADKQNIPAYFSWSLELSRPGTVIVVDNVVRDGAVIDSTSTDPSVIGVREFVEMLSGEEGVTGTTIQTVGTKGYDGFAILRVLTVLLAVIAFISGLPGLAEAQTPWQPSPGHTQVRIWPGVPPDARAVARPETSAIVVDTSGRQKLVGGKPWVYVDRVSQPTITVYSPRGRNTGAAVVVFPGGGYNVLAIDLEGTEACDWLTSRGITCVLLKYRVPCAKTGPYRDCLTALQDGQRTIGLVRFHAAQWHVDPNKIGVLGFSAGGHMVATTSTHFDRRLYPAVDAADKVSCRPDFAIALYPGHLAVPEKNFALNPDIRVTDRTPPTFILQAEDDPVDPVENSLVYHAALRRARVPVELHLFVKGGHAFGMRRTASPITDWPQLLERWLQTIGMISK